MKSYQKAQKSVKESVKVLDEEVLLETATEGLLSLSVELGMEVVREFLETALESRREAKHVLSTSNGHPHRIMSNITFCNAHALYRAWAFFAINSDNFPSYIALYTHSMPIVFLLSVGVFGSRIFQLLLKK